MDKFTADDDNLLNHQFNKYIFDSSSPQAKKENYEKDHKERKYRNIEHVWYSALDEYVHDGSVTIRYLILFEHFWTFYFYYLYLIFISK